MRANACRSDSKRAITSLVSMPSLMTFIATVRRMGASCEASHTVPIPPFADDTIQGRKACRDGLIRPQQVIGEETERTGPRFTGGFGVEGSAGVVVERMSCSFVNRETERLASIHQGRNGRRGRVGEVTIQLRIMEEHCAFDVVDLFRCRHRCAV